MGKARDIDGDTGVEEGIKGLMRAAGFTSISELSEHSGVSVRTIFNCKNKIHRPTRGTISLLAWNLNVTPEELEKVLSDQE